MDVRPALEAEDFADLAAVRSHVEIGSMVSRHRIAAWALYGQPFGFTWDGVDAVRTAAYELRLIHQRDEAERLDKLADRIAALLPPRDNA